MAVVLIPRERDDGERRVAATPESVRALTELGLDVRIESGAGAQARIPDVDYVEAGATVSDALDWTTADLVLTVGPPRVQDAAQLSSGTILVGLLAAHRHGDVIRTLAERGVTALAMEQVPRITRAQRMDALSSQANLAGYRAAVLAAFLLDKHFPLAMTAAGTIRPATVVVLGAGVAGLQAIATARRLGANVLANDIRPAARGEVESLGGEFIDLEAEAQLDGGGEDVRGYATEVGEDFLTAQRRVLGRHLADAHAVITTAFVPGKPAPTLVTREMVEGMRAGSVLIDLAAAEGGNCELTPADGEVDHGDVRIIAARNLAGDLPGESSALYARNLLALTKVLLPPADGDADEGASAAKLVVDAEDEIIGAMRLTAGGEIVHDGLRTQLSEEGATP